MCRSPTRSPWSTGILSSPDGRSICACGENPFLRERVASAGRDKTERRTAVPIFRDIPAAKQPPSTVRELKVRELKETRPLVKERAEPYVKPRPVRRRLRRRREYVPSPVEKERQRQTAPRSARTREPKETRPPSDKAPAKVQESKPRFNRPLDRPSGSSSSPRRRGLRESSRRVRPGARSKEMSKPARQARPASTRRNDK